ncbi:MAG: hypothetical protein U1C50_00280 [Patescibacteria group bacterium]|nr:hypothetical protein [Patescibacteria group bacterium]
MDLSLQIFTHEVGGGLERENNQGWTEHPRAVTGWPDGNTPLYESGQSKVFFNFLPEQPNGIAIVSNGKVKVWAENEMILGFDKEYITAHQVVILPGQAVNPGGRAEIHFNQIGQSVDLRINVNETTVKEVRIVSIAKE